MKRIIILLIGLMMLAIPVSAMPPPAEFTSYEDEGGTALIAAAGYTDAIQVHLGMAFPLSAKIYTFADFMAGDYGSALTGKLGYLLSVSGGTYMGLLAGPEAQWLNIPEDGADPMLYIAGATGIIIGHSYTNFGIFGMVQRVFPLEDNKLSNSYSFVAGIHLNL